LDFRSKTAPEAAFQPEPLFLRHVEFVEHAVVLIHRQRVRVASRLHVASGGTG
jgi:hypothetical protein